MKFKKIFLFLLLIPSLIMGQSNADFNVLNVTKNFGGPVVDTIAKAFKLGEVRTRPQDSISYRWNGQFWASILTGIAGSTIPNLNTVLSKGNSSSIGISVGPSIFTSLSVPSIATVGQVLMVVVNPNGTFSAQTIPGGVSTINSINGLTAAAQLLKISFTVATSPSWVDVTATHTLNLPLSTTADTGLTTPAEVTLWNAKWTPPSGGTTGEYIDGTLALHTFPYIPDSGIFTTSGGGITITGTWPNLVFSVSGGGSGISSLIGDVAGSGTGAVNTTIQPNVVTYAKFQEVGADSLIGNATGSLANIKGIGLGRGLIFSGLSIIVDTTQMGSINYNNNHYLPLVFNSAQTLITNGNILNFQDGVNHELLKVLAASNLYIDTTGAYEARVNIIKGTPALVLSNQMGVSGTETEENLYITPTAIIINEDTTATQIVFNRNGTASFPGHTTGFTEALSDNSTRYATTAYVKGQGSLLSIHAAPLDSAAPVSNGYQVIGTSIIQLQTGTETNPGLLSILAKKELDSMYTRLLLDTTYLGYAGAGIQTMFASTAHDSLYDETVKNGTYIFAVKNIDSSYQFNLDSASLRTYFNNYYALAGTGGSTNITTTKLPEYILIHSSTGTGDTVPLVNHVHSGVVDTGMFSELTNPIYILNDRTLSSSDSLAYSNGDTIYLKGIKFTSTGSTLIPTDNTTQNTISINFEVNQAEAFTWTALHTFNAGIKMASSITFSTDDGYNIGSTSAAVGTVYAYALTNNNGNINFSVPSSNTYTFAIASTSYMIIASAGVSLSTNILFNANATYTVGNSTNNGLSANFHQFISNGIWSAASTGGTNYMSFNPGGNVSLQAFNGTQDWYITRSGTAGSGDDSKSLLNVNGFFKTDSAVQFVNIPVSYTTSDTSTHKPMSMDASGNIFRETYWPLGSTFTRQNITTGSSITGVSFTTNKLIVWYNFVSTVSTYSFTMPPTSGLIDGQVVEFEAGGTLTYPSYEITTMTVIANSGQSFNETTPVVILQAGMNGIAWRWNVSGSMWSRLN